MSNHAYYYLLSSLPSLKFGEPSSISEEKFLEYCTDQLGEKIVLSFRQASPLNCCETKVDILEKWNKWITYTHNLSLKTRGELLEIDYQQYARLETELFPSYKRHIEEAMNIPNPKTQTTEFYSISWKYIDELECCCHFSYENIVSYWLKLQINSLVCKNNKDGNHDFHSACTHLLEEAKSLKVVIED